MKKVLVDNVVAMIEKPIKNARIIGLSQWEGKKAIIIITNEEKNEGKC